MIDNELNNMGLFVPNNFTWDINLADVNDDNIKELLVRLYQNVNTMCTALNLKDSGYYIQNEFVNGQQYFANKSSLVTPQDYRQVFRMVVNFGALPNNSSISIPHNISPTGSYNFTRIYGTASDPVDFLYIPIPYASSTLENNIELYVDQTNVTIITTVDYSYYTTCYVVLEYVKQ